MVLSFTSNLTTKNVDSPAKSRCVRYGTDLLVTMSTNDGGYRFLMRLSNADVLDAIVDYDDNRRDTDVPLPH